MFRRSVKIAYIGGGSKAWARSFMQDLALAGDLAGEVALYDIDAPAGEYARDGAEQTDLVLGVGRYLIEFLTFHIRTSLYRSTLFLLCSCPEVS